MHEAGIAANIIEIAETVARERASAPILKVHLRLGTFTGVVREALEFAFEALKPDTLASHALLEIETIPLIGACPACFWTGPPEEDYCLICPLCSTPASIVSGRELEVEYVDLDDFETVTKGETIDGTNRDRSQSPEPERPDCGNQPAVI